MEGNKFGRFLFLAKTSVLMVAVIFAVVISASVALAAAPVAPTGAYVSTTSTNSMVVTWVWGSGTETYFTVDQSTDGLTYTHVSSSIATTTLSYTFAGLSPDTLYYFRVASASSTHTATSSYSTTSAAYTLATAPTSSNAVVQSPSVINFTWTGDATAYYAENITAGTNSGWVTDTNFSSTGLSCNTTYTFYVKGRNGDLVATAYSDTQLATISCGSGGEDPSPATPATPAVPATPATPAVPGETPAIPAVPATPAIPASITVSNVPGSIIKVNASDRPAVYYVIDGKKYLFVNRATYTTWSSDAGDSANNFSTLTMVSQAEFDAIPTGGNLIAKPGSLIKFDNSPIIYAVATGGKLYQLADSAAQTALYGTAVPAVIQTGFRDGYYDHGNAVGTLTASSQKPE
ncbi:MAG: fibronectin type III domain-containing protein [Patescibacteria group bacterium]|jgi:hypothetical protein